jgi:hypothetical protein
VEGTPIQVEETDQQEQEDPNQETQVGDLVLKTIGQKSWKHQEKEERKK